MECEGVTPLIREVSGYNRELGGERGEEFVYDDMQIVAPTATLFYKFYLHPLEGMWTYYILTG